MRWSQDDWPSAIVPSLLRVTVWNVPVINCFWESLYFWRNLLVTGFFLLMTSIPFGLGTLKRLSFFTDLISYCTALNPVILFFFSGSSSFLFLSRFLHPLLEVFSLFHFLLHFIIDYLYLFKNTLKHLCICFN